MIDIPKRLLEKAKNTNDRSEIEMYLMNNYPMPQIIKAFAELYLLIADDANNKPQIPVSQAEYEQIMGLFRIRGVKMVDGEMVTEKRGRPRKVVRDDNENVLSAKTIFNEDNEE